MPSVSKELMGVVLTLSLGAMIAFQALL